MFASNALEGKTILITRPSSQTTESIEAVRRHGGNPLVFPVLAIMDPDSWDACDAALKGIQAYDAVVFTSANGVSGLDKRAMALGLSMNLLALIPVYAVGDATAARLLKHGVRVAAVPQNHSAEGLREIFEGKPVSGKRFLLVQGSIARQDLRDSLESQGAITDQIVVYRTVEVVPPQTEALVALLKKGAIDVVTFASPSAVRSFFHATHSEALFRAGDVPIIAVIGSSTSDEVTKRGLPVSVTASTSTMDGLIEAVRDHFLEVQNEK